MHVTGFGSCADHEVRQVLPLASKASNGCDDGESSHISVYGREGCEVSP